MFQFTHPGRGATLLESGVLLLTRCFNSRTPGGVRPRSGFASSDLASFNSRTPGGVRQDVPSDDDVDFPVSIHAPREGCDEKRSQ